MNFTFNPNILITIKNRKKRKSIDSNRDTPQVDDTIISTPNVGEKETETLTSDEIHCEKSKSNIKQMMKKRSNNNSKDAKIPDELYFRVGRFYGETSMNPDEVEKLETCEIYYVDNIVETILIPLITQKHVVSLRSLDWLATNYSKKYMVTRIVIANGIAEMVNIHSDYEDWLRRNRRPKFDAFRRRKRIYFQHRDKWYETTVGQLVFLYWMLSRNIFQYVVNNIQEINEDMNRCMALVRQEKAEAKAQGLKRKRKQLTQQPKTKCVIYKFNIRTKFDPEEAEEEDTSMKDTPLTDTSMENTPSLSREDERSILDPDYVFPNIAMDNWDDVCNSIQSSDILSIS